MIIAIDGPSAAGKGTLAHRLAQYLGFAHLDSGKLYRAVGLSLLRRGNDPSDSEAAISAARALRLEDIDDPELGSDEAARAATLIATIPKVREALLPIQREFAATPPKGAKGVVMDGRDIGTVVFPEADHKFFVTASLEARAARRLKELREKGVESIHSRVFQDMKERDTRDSSRENSPLMPAPDAHLLDTTDLDANQAFAAAIELIEQPSGSGRARQDQTSR